MARASDERSGVIPEGAAKEDFYTCTCVRAEAASVSF